MLLYRLWARGLAPDGDLDPSPDHRLGRMKAQFREARALLPEASSGVCLGGWCLEVYAGCGEAEDKYVQPIEVGPGSRISKVA